MRARWLIAVGLAAVAGLGAGAASAQELAGAPKEEAPGLKKEGGGKEGGHEGKEEGRLPVSVPERGITLGNFILSPALDFDVTHISVSVGTKSASATALGWGLGARFGIGPDFDFSVTPLVLEDDVTAGDFNYVGPAVQATYRFLNIKNTFEMGARVQAQFKVTDPSAMVLTPWIPARLHIARIAALDTGVEVPISIPFSGGSTSAGLLVPLTFLIDVVEPVFHVGVGTGFGILDFNDAGHTNYIPLQFLAGVAIPGKDGPILDIDPSFTFPYFITPGSNGDKVQPGLWQVGLAVEGYLYL